MPRWKKQFNIRSYHVDVNRRLTLPSLCNYFQEVAWEHAEDLDFGYHFLKSEGKFWVLSRMQGEICSYPLWGEEITVTTWPRGADGLFALREFLVTSSDNTILAAATSSWLILDEEKHRPQRLDPGKYARFSEITDSVSGKVAEKIVFNEQLRKEDAFRVKFSDIDVNRHVNNVKYIGWAIDSLPETILLTKEIASFSVNFLAESSLGDSIALWKGEQDRNDFQVSLTNESSEKEVCRVKVTMR